MRGIWKMTLCCTLLLSLSACIDPEVERRIRNIRIATRIQNVTVRGTVVSETEQPLPRVTVTAINLFTRLKTSATSGEHGYYSISGLRSGEYYIHAELENYGSTCVTVDHSWDPPVLGDSGRGILLDRNRTVKIKLKLRDWSGAITCELDNGDARR